MKKMRFYFDSEGNDDQAYREAIAVAIELAKRDPSISRIVLLVPSRDSVGWYERIFGEGAIKGLTQGKNIADCGATITIETVKTYKDAGHSKDVVIASGLDSNEVFVLDNFYCVAAIIAIPWMRSRSEKWIRTWNPKELRESVNAYQSYPLPSCVAQEAMKNLTEAINMSTGLSHPSDNTRAKTYILALHKYEASLKGEEIFAFLVRELNWRTDHAFDLEALINTLNSGKHFQGGDRNDLKRWYDLWLGKCKND